MTHYEDLSPYQYVGESIPAGVNAANVGWLEPEVEYTRGQVPDGFIDALANMVRNGRQMKMRGWHGCRLPHIDYKQPYPATVEIDGQKISLGGAEVRVKSKSGDWLIAPDLILHYVAHHDYHPPAEFIDAILKQRIAPHFEPKW